MMDTAVERNTIHGLEAIRTRLRPFLESHGVLKAIVFGSYAWGVPSRRSDLDLALVIDTDRRFFERYDQVAGIHAVIPGLPLEMLIYKPGEMEAISHRRFIRRILDEGVVIYER
jgi:predicted nucleotidyltransferase